MGDSESKTWPDEINRQQPIHDPAAERREIERLVRQQQQKMDEEMMRAILGPMPPLEHLTPPPEAGTPDSIFNVDPQAYDIWRNGKQQPTASQIDPKLLEKLRQHIGQHVVAAKPKAGHVPYTAPKAGVYQVNGRKVIIDELSPDYSGDIFLGDYPHMDPISRKQESCRHHPINVGFNTDKWVCKICDKDLDAPIDWDTKR